MCNDASMARCDKKVQSDLNYVGHKAIHINLSFTRSRCDVEIVGAEILLLNSALVRINISRMFTCRLCQGPVHRDACLDEKE